MKILHTADWHIGSLKGPEQDGVNLRSVDTLNCLNELVRVAEQEKPQLTLVSGDIFHQAEVWQGRSHREVLQAREIIMKLASASENVIVMRGTPNHDSEEAFDELKAHFELVDNVKVITTPEVIITPHANVAVLPGFDKGAFRAKFPGLSKEEENQTFSDEIGNIVASLGALSKDSQKLSILMSHYTVPGCNTESGQTQFLTQFEPIISQDMLMAADFDLVALGHIHRPQVLPNLDNVYYSGAINAMNFNDEGQERGFWIHHAEYGAFGKDGMVFTDSEFHKTPYRQFLTITWNQEDVERAITNPELLPMEFAQKGVADKIVRIIYSCTPEQKKAINTSQIEKALYEAGAFWKSDIAMDKLEGANRTELSKFDDPETNLIQYLTEKMIEPEKIDQIVERARPIIARALASDSTSDVFGTFVPKQIEVKNYRNYAEESFSFEDISFCTINGQNGAGKSSLFMDAILDCLYEEPREGSNTGWIRNDEKARSGSISFTFGLGEKTYRVVRTRTKSGKGTLNLAELVEGEWIDRSKEKYKDTQEEIIKVLGMDSLTFKACVLIMQDQYGLFLEAGKDIRIDVLSNLIGLEVYNAMEEMAHMELGNLKRKIAGQKNTIAVHETTIAGYGNPQDELLAEERELAIQSEVLTDLGKKKEEKSVILRMQNEAAERRNKVEASVNTLRQKKAATEQNISTLTTTITSCDAVLASETETLEKAERHKELVELDKGLVEAATVYQTKTDELVGLEKQLADEQVAIIRLESSIAEKQSELDKLQSSEDDEIIRSKAAEYEEVKKGLDAAYERERSYRDVAHKMEEARYMRAAACAEYETRRKHLVLTMESYQRRAELLETVECVDIENAHCGFLADALQAKKTLEGYPALLEQRDEEHKASLVPLDTEIAAYETELAEMNFDEKEVSRITSQIAELKPYYMKLQELNQRESQIALIKASIEHLQSNILEAEKRVLQVKSKAESVKESLETYKESAEKHMTVSIEIGQLAPYVDKAATYPVFHERKKNAESQKEDEIIRLVEIERELGEAVEELFKTAGATMDVAAIEKEISDITTTISAVSNQIATRQQNIGSLRQKLEEIERLQKEVAEIQKDIRLVSADIAEFDLLKTAFSKAGIPHQIIRTLVPKLTEISSSILGQMTGGKAGIEFQLERMQKNGKEVTALDIYIEEYGKSVLPYLSKSGGEKVRASLSVILALAEVKSSSAGIQLGMLFIDEPPFLDGEGIQAYCDALETIQSRYPDLKIMAITHDPTMKARFPQSLDVVKTENGSKVVY